MRTLITVLAATALLTHWASAQEKKPEQTPAKPLLKIGTGDATNHYSETMIVTGMVAQVSIREKLVYINLDKKFPESPFTCVIFARATNDFGDIKAIEGKPVEVSGKIEAYRNKPQIVLSSTNQLKVLQAAAGPTKP
jgi:DNA/RNA endonuclease YhcR with UshA esterase domain